MKKLLKICLIIVAALAAAGVILVCVATVNVSRGPSLDELNQTEWMRSRGWHISKQGPFSWRITNHYGNKNSDETTIQTDTEGQYEYNSSEVKEISLSTGSDYVQIQPSEDDQIRVKILDDADYSVSLTDSRLEITSATSGFQFGFTLESDEAPQAILYLPDDYMADRLELKVGSGELTNETTLRASTIVLGTGSGEIDLEQEIIAGSELLADAGSGDLNLKNMNCKGRFRIAVGSGDASVTGSVQGDVKADAGSGEIELDLQGISEQDAYEIACGSGDVKINKKYYDKSTTVTATGGDSTLWLTCGSGSIRLTCDSTAGQHHSEDHSGTQNSNTADTVSQDESSTWNTSTQTQDTYESHDSHVTDKSHSIHE